MFLFVFMYARLLSCLLRVPGVEVPWPHHRPCPHPCHSTPSPMSLPPLATCVCAWYCCPTTNGATGSGLCFQFETETIELASVTLLALDKYTHTHTHTVQFSTRWHERGEPRWKRSLAMFFAGDAEVRVRPVNVLVGGVGCGWCLWVGVGGDTLTVFHESDVHVH